MRMQWLSHCLPCRHGEYQATSGATSCQKCEHCDDCSPKISVLMLGAVGPGSKYQQAKNATSCNDCEVLKTYRERKHWPTCEACGEGQYNKVQGGGGIDPAFRKAVEAGDWEGAAKSAS